VGFLTVKVNGVTVPVPFKQPYQWLHTSLVNSEVFRMSFTAPLRPTRLALPADYAGDKLVPWNQKYGDDYGNPYQGTLLAHGDDNGTVGQLLINSGASVYINSYDYLTLHKTGASPASYKTKFNWQHDKVNHKYSYEFILDNDLEETDPTVIADDDQTAYWTADTNCTLSDDAGTKVKGTNSLKIVISGGVSNFSHDYGAGSLQDWSAKEFIGFYWYGANTGHSYSLVIFGPTFGDYFSYAFTDNFVGWKRFVVPLKSIGVDGGTPSLSTVRAISFSGLDDGDTMYLDRVLVDVGQWVKVEAYVPDALVQSADADPHPKITISAWNGTDYIARARYNVDNRTAAGAWADTPGSVYNSAFFLDGSKISDIYGEVDEWNANGWVLYSTGERGITEGFHINQGGGSVTIDYSSNYGCQKRIGFAIKMPPDDGQDSSTGGISQCRLKLEVYYDDSENPTPQYKDTVAGRVATLVGSGITHSNGTLVFDGTANYIDTPLTLDWTANNWTICLWASRNVAAASNFKGIFSNRFGAGAGHWLTIGRYNVNRAVVEWGTGTAIDFDGNDCPTSLTHYAVVKTGTLLSLYLNGVLVNTQDIGAASIGDTTNAVKLGNWLALNADQAWHGVIDDVRIYNTNKTTTEILAIKNGVDDRVNIFAQWNFDIVRDYGQTTYEFSNDNNAYYGLTNWGWKSATLTGGNPWLALFDATTKQVYGIGFSKRPTGLKVCADENENINWIEATLPAGTVVYAGESYRADLAVDTDGDGVPNFLEETYDPSLVLDLPMDEIVGGKVLDRTTNHNDGTLVGATHLPTLVAGKIGNAIQFDGVDDIVEIADAANLDVSAITIMYWYKASPGTVGVRNAHIGRGVSAPWDCGFENGNATVQQIYMYVGGVITYPSMSGFTTDDVWYHVAWVYPDSLRLKGYKNGAFRTQTGELSGNVDSGTDGIHLGYRDGAYQAVMLDDVRVYNRALPAAEIRAIYNSGRRGHPNGMSAMMKGIPNWS